MGYANTLSPNGGEEHSLSTRINTATRTTHTQLNRLIIARLPLALPPHTTNPSTYVSILLHVTPIYTTFESLWNEVLDSPDYAERIRSVLSALKLPGLARSQALLGDISGVSGLCMKQIQIQLQDESQISSRLSIFLEHIRKTVPEKPHIILAYTWILYMALFSGGRYIRATLKNARKDFWMDTPMSTSLQPTKNHNLTPKSDDRTGKEGLEFFHFPGVEDGEDIKQEFKRRFFEVEKELNQRQKEEIVQEAQRIFLFLLDMMGELDQKCGPSKNDVKQTNSTNFGTLLSGRRLQFLPRNHIFASKIDRRTYVVLLGVCCVVVFMVWYVSMIIKLRSLIQM